MWEIGSFPFFFNLNIPHLAHDTGGTEGPFHIFYWYVTDEISQRLTQKNFWYLQRSQMNGARKASKKASYVVYNTKVTLHFRRTMQQCHPLVHNGLNTSSLVMGLLLLEVLLHEHLRHSSIGSLSLHIGVGNSLTKVGTSIG